MSHPIIGCVQLNCGQDIDYNLKVVTQAITKASKLGVSLIVLPENMLSMGQQSKLAERFDDLSATLATLAHQHNIYILAGTLPCPYRPDGKPVPNGLLRQVSQMFAPDGKSIARYDKIHLFRAQVSDSTGSYDEGRTFEAGDKLVVATCELLHAGHSNLANHADKNTINVGMMVCFDLRFASLSQRLRSFGADILTAPSAFTYPTGKAHWQLLLQARALDAQCMVVGAAQGGIHHPINKSEQSRHTWGHATITNANGEVVNQYPSDIITPDNTTNTDSFDNNLPASINNTLGQKSHCHVDSDYVLLTTPFDLKLQHQWRQNLPIQRCHRLG